MLPGLMNDTKKATAELNVLFLKHSKILSILVKNLKRKKRQGGKAKMKIELYPQDLIERVWQIDKNSMRMAMLTSRPNAFGVGPHWHRT